MHRARNSWLRSACVAAALALPVQAFAHGTLQSSTPAAGAHLSVVPASISLLFTERPSLTLTTVVLIGPTGETISLGPLTSAPDSRLAVTTAIDGALPSGVYTVRWQMAGDDGHPTTGSYRFTLALAASVSGGQPPAMVPHENPISQPDAPGFGVESPAYVAIRWLQYAAVLMLIGAVAFALLVVTRLQRVSEPALLPSARSRAARVGLWATGLLAATALMRLLAQSYALHGETLAPDLALIGTLLRVTQWGHAWLLEVGAVIVALVAFSRARRGSVRAWAVAAVAAIAVTVSMALSGHAAASPTLVTLAIIADALHILGAGGWLGSLLVLVVVGLPAAMAVDIAQRWRTVALLVNGFSPTALVFAAITAVTGLFAAWLHVESIAALWQTRYGQVLLLKLAVLSVTAGIGLYNWRRVQPILDAGPDGTRRLYRSAAVELSIGLVVILVTAVLVATPSGMDM